MMRRSIIILFLLSAVRCHAQQTVMDSLLTLLKTDQPDTLKMLHLYQLSDECEMTGSYQAGLNHCENLMKLGDEILARDKDSKVQKAVKKYKGKAYNMMGLIYFALGNYPEALKSHFASIKIKEEIGNRAGIASSYNNIGNVYINQGDFEGGLKNYFAALKIFEELCENKSATDDCQYNIAGARANIGVVYKEQGNYEEALKNHFISLKIREELKDQPGIADSYGNIGNVYDVRGEYENALKYDLDALKIYELMDEKAGLAGYYTNIGLIYIKQKKYTDARNNLMKAGEIAGLIGHKEILRDVNCHLAELDSVKGDFKAAYEHHKLFILYKDSLDNEETRRKTIQSQMTFDFEKKEAVATAEHKKELENQELIAEEKSRKQRIVLILVSIFLLLVVLFAGFIFRSLRITRKQKDIIEVQKSVVEQQKAQVEYQKALVEEHQKEIIDSIYYARRIQCSLLPTEMYIERNINRLRRSQK